LVLVFPLSRAEHRRGGRKKARGLSESAVANAKAGEFPRAPVAATGRLSKHHAVRQDANRSEARSPADGGMSTWARLATPHGGMRRRFIDRLDDAQGQTGHGRVKPVTPFYGKAW